MFIDCHVHLFFSPIPKKAVEEDIIGEIPVPTMKFTNRMISNAKEKDVSHFVGVISNPKDFPNYEKQLEIKNTIHVIGISRNNSLENHAKMISLLRDEIDRRVPHAIGEIGLDYTHGFENMDKNERRILMKNQQELFRKQIRIAKELDIPIVVHAGFGDDKDILDIIKQERAQDVSGQIHGYISKEDVVLELLDLGFYFSFGYSHITIEVLRKIIEITPLEKILTETDAPYHLIQTPKRFILPEDVVLVTSEIAKLKELKIESVANRVMGNAKKLFRF